MRHGGSVGNRERSSGWREDLKGKLARQEGARGEKMAAYCVVTRCGAHSPP